MPNPIVLASGQVAHGTLTIQLIQPDGPVTIDWPDQPLSVSPAHFPGVAAALTRLLSSASIELARHKAGTR